ncbi:iron chelate uptake ABC transporter family permease subunit [Pseudonocardia kongjuensis]|uniref:Iron chelate uptake ABC transporter family permease subunit n=1 Tax=Pseudonocardia kongjuensis TaxID=102227 RepID=A0ABN1YCN5_9PSEU
MTGVVSGRALRTPGERIALRVLPRAVLVCAVLVAVLAATAVVGLTVGDFDVPPADVLAALRGEATGRARFIVTGLRLPRLLVAMLVGAALGVAGAIFQGLSRNPLGSPDIIGFTAGSATGALLVLLVGRGGTAGIAAGAVFGGFAAAVLVYLLSYRRGVSGFRLILVGIGVSAMLGGVNAYLVTRAQLRDAQAAQLWLTGSVNGRGWDHVTLIGLTVLVLLPFAVLLGRALPQLELGDEVARARGLVVERSRALLMLVGIGLTAVATAVAGPIAFVALAAPQIARRLTRTPGPGLVPAALTGAALLTVGDVAAQRIFAPVPIPVGVATAALGGIYLAWLLARQWRSGRG